MREIEKVFSENKIRIVYDDAGERWIPALDVAKALEYKNPYVASKDLINRNADIFTEISGISKLLMPNTRNEERETTVLNLDGVIAFCMKANRPKAIHFQKWAIGVLRERIEESYRQNGLNNEKVRLIATEKRNTFTDALKSHGINKPHEYIQLTYLTKLNLGIDRTKKKKDCDLIEVMKIALAEDLSTLKIIQDKPSGYREIKPVVGESSAQIAQITTKQIKGE